MRCRGRSTATAATRAGATACHVSRASCIERNLAEAAISTTTIRLPEELKARIDKLAASAGKSTHAFMVEALGQSAELAERQQAFEAEVNKRWARLRRTRQAHTLEDLRDCGLALAAGERRPRPKTHKLDLPLRKARAA